MGIIQATTGLLVVDLQSGFEPSAELVKSINNACAHYTKVAATKFSNPVDGLYRSVLDWHGDGGDLLLVSQPGIVIEKTCYGLPPEGIDLLRATGCREWHLCGIETDACVLACAFSLWDAGLIPVIRQELCAGPLHDLAILIAKRQFGRIA